MHNTKFQIGDIVSSVKDKVEYKVVQMVFERKELFGNWQGGSKSIHMGQCYVLKDKDGWLSWIPFTYEPLFKKVNQQVCVPSCLRCGGVLQDHMSFGLGEVIKKCKSCGWC